jgi:hypothetical protein
MATLPGEPGWLPSIPGPPEWPYLDVRVAELMATRRRDHEGVELQINQEFAGGASGRWPTFVSRNPSITN